MKRISTVSQNGSYRSVNTAAPKVGSYAKISSGNSRPWANGTPKKNVGKKTANRRRKKKILNPIFAECFKIATDPFWKDKFEKASYGKFPRGFSYNKGYLIYKRGAKNDSVAIPESPHEAYSVCVFFFHDAAKIYSDQDRKQIKEEEYQLQLLDQLKEKTWAKTLKRQKEILVEIYVHELKDKYKLSVNATRKLEDLVNVGILFNHFNKDNIILEDGMIKEIKGLEFNPQTKSFIASEPLKPKLSKSSSKAKKLEPSPFPRHIPFQKERPFVFADEWSKFLDQTIKPIPLKKKEGTLTGVKIAHVSSPTTPFPRSSTDDYTESTFTPILETISTE